MGKRRNSKERNIRRTGLKLAAVALGMFAFGYALVPLYNVICEVTGLNGKTGRVEVQAENAADVGRWVTVEFTGNSMSGLPWEFRPQQKTLRVHPGQTAVAYYEARNTTAEAITGQAVPSVAPNKAAAHFKKIECFCFTRQTLAARETRQMPVRFVVDANLPRDVHTVTLSYAFFNADQASARKYGGNAPAVATHEHHAADGQAAGG
jgi:cytochrome c oxidase assembly protein subunit 11